MKLFLQTRPVLALFVLSLVAGLLAAVAVYFAATTQGLNPGLLTGDSKGYILLAQNLLERQTFSVATTAPFYPESFRSPGYPFFLSVLFVFVGSWAGVLFLQALLLCVVPVLLYLLLREYHERAAFWGSLVFALEPLRLFYSASLLSDALFACLLLCSLLLLKISAKEGLSGYALLTGAVLGLSILVRPIALFLPLLFAAYLLWAAMPRRHALRLSVMLCLAALLVVLPWSLRNHTLFGSYNVSSVGAANLMLYNAPAFVAYHPTPQGESALAAFQKEQEALPREEALSLSRSGVFTQDFKQVIAGQELHYAVFHLVKTVPFFITDGLRDTVRLFKVDIGVMPNLSTALLRGDFALAAGYVLHGGFGILLFVVGVGFWSAVCILSLVTLYRALRGKASREWLFLAAVVLYFALLTGPVSNARYRLPVEGLLLVAAAGSVFELKSRWYDKSST